MKVAVIGSGIAGQMLIYNLLKAKNLQKLDWYSADSFAPACSSSTTSIVRRSGITSGVSPLGDLLLESFEAFESLYESDKHLQACIDKSLHYELYPHDDEKLLERYPPQADSEPLFSRVDYKTSSEQVYVVYPMRFKKYILDQFQNSGLGHLYSELVVEVKENKDSIFIQSQSETREYDYVFSAVGWNYAAYYQHPKFKNHVSGHYLELSAHFLDSELTQDSWSLSIDKINFIFRKKSQCLLVSAVNKQSIELLGSPSELGALYENAQQLFPTWNWPKLNSENLKVGVRVKGQKRYPISEWTTPRHASLNGLYKNGFSYAVKLSKDLINEMGEKEKS